MTEAEQNFITTTKLWWFNDNRTIVISQTPMVNAWHHSGYIKILMDNPMSEYTYIGIKLTEYGQALIDFDEL